VNDADGPIVALLLRSRPQTLTIVRGMLSGLAELLEMDPELLDDLKTSVSEACNNVVLHAYDATPGPLILSLAVQGDSVELVVRDQGSGIRPGAGRNRGLGMGVTLINSLADRAEFESSEFGTEVRMRFRRPACVPEPLERFSLARWALTDPRSALTDQQSSSALQARSN